MGKTFFISDLHFGHTNVLKFDNRPYFTIEDHDANLIERWNHAVCNDDVVYILGDVSWHDAGKTIEILNSLNGSKHLIVGNHDKQLLKNKKFRDCFLDISDYKEIDLNAGRGNYNIVLCHYPIPCFNRHYYGAYHLYGHVHNSFEWNMMEHLKAEMTQLYSKPCNMYNVGCMIPYMDYTPRTLEAILCSDIIRSNSKTEAAS